MEASWSEIIGNFSPFQRLPLFHTFNQQTLPSFLFAFCRVIQVMLFLSIFPERAERFFVFVKAVFPHESTLGPLCPVHCGSQVTVYRSQDLVFFRFDQFKLSYIYFQLVQFNFCLGWIASKVIEYVLKSQLADKRTD